MMAEADQQGADAKSANGKTPGQNSWLWLLTLILAIAFIGSGLVGRMSWKLQDAQTFETVQTMAESGDRVVPQLGQEPDLSAPPLYYMTAVELSERLSEELQALDATRLSTGVFLALTLMFAWSLGRLTWMPAAAKGVGATGAMTVLMLIATLGIAWFGHDLAAESALMAGTTMGLYGLLRLPRSTFWGGFWFGTGLGIAFMAKGLLGPAILGITALIAPFFATPGGVSRQLRGILLGLLFAAPWLLVWPWLLQQRDPQLFELWLWGKNLDLYLDTMSLGTPAHQLEWLKVALIMAFPAWLLAALALILRPGALFGVPGVRLALIFSLVGWVIVLMGPSVQPILALPLLVPLAVIAVGGMTRMPELLVVVFKWLSTLVFGLIALSLWGLWIYLKYQGEVPQIEPLAAVLPTNEDFLFQEWIYLVAAGLTVLWLWIVTHFRAPRAASMLAWPAGVVMLWSLLVLHQPWVDRMISEHGLITGLTLEQPIVMTQNAQSAASGSAADQDAEALTSGDAQ